MDLRNEAPLEYCWSPKNKGLEKSCAAVGVHTPTLAGNPIVRSRARPWFVLAKYSAAVLKRGSVCVAPIVSPTPITPMRSSSTQTGSRCWNAATYSAGVLTHALDAVSSWPTPLQRRAPSLRS